MKALQPKIQLIDQDTIDQILAEAFQLLMEPGVKVQSRQALELLAQAGATVDFEQEVAKIPENIGANSAGQCTS